MSGMSGDDVFCQRFLSMCSYWRAAIVEVGRRLVHRLSTYIWDVWDFDSIGIRFFSKSLTCDLFQKSHRGVPCTVHYCDHLLVSLLVNLDDSNRLLHLPQDHVQVLRTTRWQEECVGEIYISCRCKGGIVSQRFQCLWSTWSYACSLPFSSLSFLIFT